MTSQTSKSPAFVFPLPLSSVEDAGFLFQTSTAAAAVRVQMRHSAIMSCFGLRFSAVWIQVYNMWPECPWEEQDVSSIFNQDHGSIRIETRAWCLQTSERKVVTSAAGERRWRSIIQRIWICVQSTDVQTGLTTDIESEATPQCVTNTITCV